MSRPHVFLPRVLALLVDGPGHCFGLSRLLGVERTRTSDALIIARKHGYVRDVGAAKSTRGPARKMVELTDAGRAYLGSRSC